MSFSPLVVWHDIECGGYDADLPLWRELAAAQGGPVLDVGAGTGRVALDLARAGFAVTALDREPELLAALAARAAGLDVRTVAADATAFELGAAFPLIIVPMQTVQLLPERAGFLAAAAAHLAPGGLLAMAITETIEGFDEADGILPTPDVATVGAYRFASQPTAVRALPAATRIERVRRTVGPDGAVVQEDDVIELAHVTVASLEDEGRAAGLTPAPARTIEPTAEHVGSEVVLLRG
ncbi:MAG TPA: methyltransferase domain-containing protein [Solirubrobacteraceae bacterium]|nr:methyltransferase domain-containing protein [Solirubrobacteraceae bacterium]